jgi:hypothetical protein
MFKIRHGEKTSRASEQKTTEPVGPAAVALLKRRKVCVKHKDHPGKQKATGLEAPVAGLRPGKLARSAGLSIGPLHLPNRRRAQKMLKSRDFIAKHNLLASFLSEY